MRLRSVLIGAVVVIVVLAGLGAFLALTRFKENIPTTISRACEVSTSSGTVDLDASQMANAATIAAVGIRRKLPDRAIVIALATAFQESKMENLESGDRDSVGLFQQRPSQGWGTPEQIRDPRYAAGKFYTALVRVRGWQDMRVTDAAQRVQRSAFPEAYEKWSDEATVLTEALAGQATSAVTCSKMGEPNQRGVEAATALGAGLNLDWGVTPSPSAERAGLVVAAADARVGWQYAHWLVAHSVERGVERVTYGDQEWTADRGAWATTEQPANHPGVVAQVYG